MLSELRKVEEMREVVRAFEAVGTSRPVELSPEQKATLATVIAAWADASEGILELGNTLDRI